MQVADSSLAEMSLQLFNWLGVPLSFPACFVLSNQRKSFCPSLKLGSSGCWLLQKWVAAARELAARTRYIWIIVVVWLTGCSLSFLAFFVLSAQRNSFKVGIQFMLCGCRLLHKWVAAARVGVGRSRVCGDSAGAAGEAAWSILQLLSGSSYHHPPPLPTS